MKRTLLLCLVVLAPLGLLVTGCTPPAATEVAMLATATSTAPETPTELPTDEAPPAITPEPTLAPDFYCLDCHSDAELLQQVATEEEVVESLNEGSG